MSEYCGAALRDFFSFVGTVERFNALASDLDQKTRLGAGLVDLLPDDDVIDDARSELHDALAGPVATRDDLAALISPLFTGRSAGRPETAPSRLAAVIDAVELHLRVHPAPVAVVALAALNDLRTAKWPPEPVAMIAAISAARRQAEAAEYAALAVANARDRAADLAVV